MKLALHRLLQFFSLALIGLAVGCQGNSPKNGVKAVLTSSETQSGFAEYWFAGEAELNTFDIRQNRYGEMREGEAIMVFVTEDFSKSEQVKLDNPASAGKDKVAVIKLNHIRRFVTGIYDYSMMQSVFTPIDGKQNPHTLKTTTTSQDWCGHTFTQFNLAGGQYKMSGFSYFGSEGDEVKKIKTALLEDELWSRIRLGPENIPTGSLEVIPSTFYSRLRHENLKAERANVKLEKGGETSSLFLDYKSLDRSLRIVFETKFPHRIVEWEEKDGGQLISSGQRKSVMKSAYWRENGNRYEYLRDSLRIR